MIFESLQMLKVQEYSFFKQKSVKKQHTYQIYNICVIVANTNN
jgi:hypothetical protein